MVKQGNPVARSLPSGRSQCNAAPQWWYSDITGKKRCSRCRNSAGTVINTQRKHCSISSIYSPAQRTGWLRYVTLEALYVPSCVACLQLAGRGIYGCASATVCTRKWSDFFTSWDWTLVLLLFSDKTRWRRCVRAVQLKTKIRSNCRNRWSFSESVSSHSFLALTWPFDGGESPKGAWGSPVPQTGADPQGEDGAAGKLWCGKVQPGTALQQEWVQDFIYANCGLWVHVLK